MKALTLVVLSLFVVACSGQPDPAPVSHQPKNPDKPQPGDTPNN